MKTVCVLLSEVTLMPFKPFMVRGIDSLTAVMLPEFVCTLSNAGVGGMFRYGGSANARLGRIMIGINNNRIFFNAFLGLELVLKFTCYLK